MKWLINSRKSSLQLIVALIFLISSLSGCAGLLLDAGGRSDATDKTYSEMRATLAKPVDGNGRLYIYRTKTSTKSSLQLFYGVAKNPTYFTVDDTAEELIWEAFKYIDVPEGYHEVTCGEDVLKGIPSIWNGYKGKFQKGQNKIQVLVSNGSETFIRLDAVKEEPFFQPIIVTVDQGREEMSNLPYQNKKFAVAGGKISISESK